MNRNEIFFKLLFFFCKSNVNIVEVRSKYLYSKVSGYAHSETLLPHQIYTILKMYLNLIFSLHVPVNGLLYIYKVMYC